MTDKGLSKKAGSRTAVRRSTAPGVDDLRPEEAVEVLRRLAKSRGTVGETVREEIRAILGRVDLKAIAAEVYADLAALSVEELWDRSGRTSRGYVDPAEEAWVMLEGVLRPHIERIRQHQGRGMAKEAREYCLAVLDGIELYDRESDSDLN